jgi:prepilin-type N-terminal cleavage/methylation domain-containing protein
MYFHRPKSSRPPRAAGFSLIELLTVIAIISILMTVGAIGIGSLLGGKGVTSGVASAEAVFDEARSTAVSQRTKARVLIDATNPRNPTYLRRMLVAYEELDDEGNPKTNQWTISNRGVILPDQVYFSKIYSKKSHTSGGEIDKMTLSNVGRDFIGEYYYYEFNEEGICRPASDTDVAVGDEKPGNATFVVGTGLREPNAEAPRVTASTKRDFGGFVIWRNGRTSVFRNPSQMNIPENITQF